MTDARRCDGPRHAPQASSPNVHQPFAICAETFVLAGPAPDLHALQSRRRRNRVAREGADLHQPAIRSHRILVEMRQDVRSTSHGGKGKTAPDHLGERTEIGDHAIRFQRSAIGQAKNGHHLVEDEQDAVPIRFRTQQRQEPGLGRDDPLQRLHDDCGDLPARFREKRTDVVRIAGASDQFRNSLQRPCYHREESPLLEDRERYLRAVVASGVVGDIARRVARTQLALMELLNLPDADIPVRLATVETAVQTWCWNVPEVSAADFRRYAFRWLRFLGWLDEPGWMRFWMPIRTPDRWRPSRPGRGTIGGCLKRPPATAVARATVSLPGRHAGT